MSSAARTVDGNDNRDELLANMRAVMQAVRAIRDGDVPDPVRARLDGALGLYRDTVDSRPVDVGVGGEVQAAAPAAASASCAPAWLAELMAKHGIQLDEGVVQQLVEHGVGAEQFSKLTLHTLAQRIPELPLVLGHDVLRLAEAAAGVAA